MTHSDERAAGTGYDFGSYSHPDAQDVQEVVPQAAVTMPDGYLAVDYARLVPLLIEAIKQQQQQIDSQNDEIQRLKSALRP